MTFRRLALNNVRGSWQRYLAFFLSCVLSVMVFYVFLSFNLLPEVRTGHIVGGGRVAVDISMVAVLGIVVIFSGLFILYSTSAFIRARKKEFGLLTLMGMTQRQMRLTVFYELSLIAMSALAAGLLAGILLSKLFFAAMTALLDAANPVAFAVPLLAVVITVAAFGAIFLAANWLSLYGVRASSIRELLKAAHQPKAGPRKNVWLFLLGIALTTWGYTLAWVTVGSVFSRNALPIVGLTVAGTYFFVTQGAVFICDWLRRLTEYYRRGTNLLVVNRLVFRLTDNARAIFISAVLIAIVGSALGAFNTVLQSAYRMAMDDHAYALTISPLEGQDPADLAAKASAALQQMNITGVESQISEALGGQATLPDGKRDIRIASNAAFNRWAVMNPEIEPLQLAAGQALLVLPQNPDQPIGRVDAVIEVDARRLDVHITETLIRSWQPGRSTVLVVSDTDYGLLDSGASERTSLIGFEFRDWQAWPTLAHDVTQALTAQGIDSVWVGARVGEYQTMRQSGALTLFIGMFIATLFFVAAGSLIYFKLFTEIGDDRIHYAVLRDIGLTGAELNRLVRDELATVFFVPLLIGAVHTAFALKTLSNLLTKNLNIAGPGLVVGAVYLVAQIGYFLATKAGYMREVMRQS
ncbi:MAG: FtsX-like permease family protein [Chloroflexota bacterium]